MGKEKEELDNVRHNPIFVALYFLGAVLSGAGGNYLWMSNIDPEVVVPDRFTGTEGTALIQRHEELKRSYEDHVKMSIEARIQYERRISTLEAQIRDLEKYLGVARVENDQS